jgi:hypothetical protein
MVLMLAVAAAAAVAGLIFGWRHPIRSVDVRLRWWVVLLAALVGQAVLGRFSLPIRGALAAADCVAVSVWSVLNRRSRSGLRGLPVLGAGCALNSIVIAADDGMPVSRWALTVAGLPRHLDVSRGHLDKHVAMTTSTHLRWLGDIIPVPGLRTVMSAGDVLMLAGIALAAFTAVAAVVPDHRVTSAHSDSAPLGAST